MQPCSACNRHVREPICPFCGASATQREPIDLGLGRFSRAMVFASATLAAASCASPKKQQTTPTDETEETESSGRKMQQRRHPACTHPDPEKVAEAQKKVDEAKTEEDKQEAENELAKARQTVCAPYGAPPARRRVV